MKVTGEPMSKKASAERPFSSELPTYPYPLAAVPSTILTAWPEYAVDAFQRSVLFLESAAAAWQ